MKSLKIVGNCIKMLETVYNRIKMYQNVLKRIKLSKNQCLDPVIYVYIRFCTVIYGFIHFFFSIWGVSYNLSKTPILHFCNFNTIINNLLKEKIK